MWTTERSIYRVLFTIIILIGVIGTAAFGQAKQWELPENLYGGIGVSPEGITVMALRLNLNRGEADLKLVYSEVIRIALWEGLKGSFNQLASAAAAQAVETASQRLQQQYRIPPKHIYLIGSSRMGKDYPADLVATIKEVTGLTLNFMDEATEIQLRIAGTVPQVGEDNNTLIDIRNTSALFHMGAFSTQAGYQAMKYTLTDGANLDYIGMSIPYGTVNYTDEIAESTGMNANQFAFTRAVKSSGVVKFRQALHKELERNPGMMYRKRIYLTGSLAWAMTTMLYPNDRRLFVPLSYEGIVQFADKIAKSPKELAFQNLSFIRDRKVRQEVEKELADIRETFHPFHLIAGAEMLKAAAEELRWQDKKIVFARIGDFSTLVNYVRLQATQ